MREYERKLPMKEMKEIFFFQFPHCAFVMAFLNPMRFETIWGLGVQLKPNEWGFKIVHEEDLQIFEPFFLNFRFWNFDLIFVYNKILESALKFQFPSLTQ